MIRVLRDFRIIPIALVAITALFVLKALGLVFEGGYTLSEAALRSAEQGDITGTVLERLDATPDAPAALAPPPVPPSPPAPKSWAQEVFNFPDVTGAVPEPQGKQEPKQDSKSKLKGKPQEQAAVPAGTQVPLDGGRLPSPAERALLERLSERREELDKRAKDLDMRESLVLAAEKRLEGRVAQLKQLEAQIKDAAHAKDEGEAARVRNVITMYENMRPKDAARVFDRLDMRVLVDVATQINPRRMSDIMAQMSAEAAEKLTVELASRRDRTAGDLPKIEGRASQN
jgi:flagellar motility protein MotE (MotC chaperone)